MLGDEAKMKVFRERDWPRLLTRFILPALILAAIASVAASVHDAYLLWQIPSANGSTDVEMLQPPLGDTSFYGILVIEAERMGVTIELMDAIQSEDDKKKNRVTIGRAFLKERRIAIAKNLSPEGKTCVLVHELAHMALGTSETDAYYVEATVCSSIGYWDDARMAMQVAQASYQGRITKDARVYAARLTDLLSSS